MDLDNLINRLDAFDFEAEQQLVVHENLDQLSELQKKQFAESKDANGQPIELKDNAKYGFGYRPFTIEQKKLYGIGLGRVTDRVTLYMSGDLFNEMFARIQGNTYEVASHVPYWSTLTNRLQKEATQLSEDNRRFFGETYVIPGVENALKEKVFR
jgi:hypothetical protein